MTTRLPVLALLAACNFTPEEEPPIVVTGDDDDAECVPLPEVCDGDDDDCDGEVDEGFDKAWFVDDDEDGVGDADAPVTSCDPGPGHARTPGDCDDGDPALVGPVEDVVYVDASAAA